jgi:hypothetical protein
MLRTKSLEPHGEVNLQGYHRRRNGRPSVHKDAVYKVFGTAEYPALFIRSVVIAPLNLLPLRPQHPAARLQVLLRD